jgi:hypothetical protein
MRELTLPVWAKKAEENPKVCVVIEVDSAQAYKAWLEELDVTDVDQYWLEVAYQCIKMDVQAAIAGTKFDPRSAGMSAEFRFSNAPEFALAKHPTGRGVAVATKGREARDHYRRIRGSLPF